MTQNTILSEIIRTLNRTMDAPRANTHFYQNLGGVMSQHDTSRGLIFALETYINEEFKYSLYRAESECKDQQKLNRTDALKKMSYDETVKTVVEEYRTRYGSLMEPEGFDGALRTGIITTIRTGLEKYFALVWRNVSEMNNIECELFNYDDGDSKERALIECQYARRRVDRNNRKPESVTRKLKKIHLKDINYMYDTCAHGISRIDLERGIVAEYADYTTIAYIKRDSENIKMKIIRGDGDYVAKVAKNFIERLATKL